MAIIIFIDRHPERSFTRPHTPHRRCPVVVTWTRERLRRSRGTGLHRPVKTCVFPPVLSKLRYYFSSCEKRYRLLCRQSYYHVGKNLTGLGSLPLQTFANLATSTLLLLLLLLQSGFWDSAWDSFKTITSNMAPHSITETPEALRGQSMQCHQHYKTPLPVTCSIVWITCSEARLFNTEPWLLF